MIKENKDVVRRYYEEAFNQGRTELLDDLVAEDVVNHDPVSDQTMTPEQARGFDGFRRHVETAREAFPDATITIQDMIAENDRVAARFVLEGTHDGSFAGIEPTGTRVSVSTMVFYRIQDGKIKERWAESDAMSLLAQLDVDTLPNR